ncbi:unnamed protein product [Adineta steineri]|uniref:Uncharacterized protein n=1 Tax=Adineta steineri TaxID=433720 RepID=A0A818LTV7_9BILA|nr:unnamed protein product [Adineta steineri]CAF3577572.1 unnamed protein product [Adineta steineri]
MSKAYRSQEPVPYQPGPARIVHPNDYQLEDRNTKARREQQQAQVNVVISQPGRTVWDFEHPWSTKLCSCCSNGKECCCGFFCLCCYECKLHKRAGEHMCTCMCPGARFALRSKIRTAFRIEGNLINDCCVSTCCPCCTAIQLTRELYYQGL